VFGASDSSLVRVDVQVIWSPPRSRAEYLVASRFASVRIAALSGRRPFTSASRRLIAKIVRLVDTAQAFPQTYNFCGLIMQIYQVTLVPAVSRQPAVRLTASGCGFVNVQIGGRKQPALDDNGLYDLASQLTRSR